MWNHLLLLGMLISYAMPIIYVIRHFNPNTTLSDIICDETCNKTIIFYMTIMGIFTILYEIQRKDIESIIYIIIVLITIYGLLTYGPETTTHFLFAIGCLFAIFAFMVHHSYQTNVNILYGFTFVNYLIILAMIIFVKDDIIICECAYLFFFAAFYLYLHFLPKKNDVESVNVYQKK